MMPYSKINIGDIFASPYYLSDLTYEVTDKADGLVEIRCSYQHPHLQEKIWKKPTHKIFTNRIFNAKKCKVEA